MLCPWHYDKYSTKESAFKAIFYSYNPLKYKGLFLKDFLEALREGWDDLEDVADYTVGGDFEDGCFRVFVDGDNDL